jgi:hypothetical protein
MSKKQNSLIILILFILSACTTGPTSPAAPSPTAGQTLPPSVRVETAVVVPSNPPQAAPTSIITVVSTPTATSTPEAFETPTSQEGSDMHNPVYLDQVKLITLSTSPPQFLVQISGSLPTPCHKLHVNTGEPDQQGKIEITLYSTADPNLMCAQVLTPFTQEISLKDLPSGQYSVWIDGKKAGDISVP